MDKPFFSSFYCVQFGTQSLNSKGPETNVILELESLEMWFQSFHSKDLISVELFIYY